MKLLNEAPVAPGWVSLHPGAVPAVWGSPADSGRGGVQGCFLWGKLRHRGGWRQVRL